MKTYEKIQDLEKKIHRAKEQAAFLQYQLDAVDMAIILKKQKLQEEIEAYNLRAKTDQEILSLHTQNIEKWTKKLNSLVKSQIKKIEKQPPLPEEKPKTPEELEKEQLEAKKKELEEELRKLKLKESAKEITIEEVIEDRKLASSELREFADDLNGETQQIEWLEENHPEWIVDYSNEEGGNAIWRGCITKGFRHWCEEKGYLIGF